MKLWNRITKEFEIGIIKPLNREDLSLVRQNPNFIFDWDKLGKWQLFQLQLIKNDEILGLMALQDIKQELNYYRLKPVDLSGSGRL